MVLQTAGGSEIGYGLGDSSHATPQHGATTRAAVAPRADGERPANAVSWTNP